MNLFQFEKHFVKPLEGPRVCKKHFHTKQITVGLKFDYATNAEQVQHYEALIY